MAIPTVTIAAGVAAGGPAVAFLTANTRVKARTGHLGLQLDVVQFGGPMVTGTWATAGSHVFVGAVPVVLHSSTGTAVSPAPASAAMSVTMGETTVRGS